MSDDPTKQPNPSIDTDSYAMRNESRLDTDGLHCSLGRVADITGSGMRLIVAPADLPEIGDIQSYAFSDSNDELTISGLVKWVRKPTLFTRRGEVGVEFVKLNPDTREAILRLAVQGDLNLAKDQDIKVSYPDLYKLLGSSRYASKDELQTAYRKQAKAWHPDVNDNPKASQVFEEIQQAYAVLSTKESRAQYDLRRFGPEVDPGDTFGDHPGEQAA